MAEISIRLEQSTSANAKDEIIKDPRLAAKVQHEWNASAALRSEFGDNLPSYQAYRKAETEGKVKIVGSNGRGNRA